MGICSTLCIGGEKVGKFKQIKAAKFLKNKNFFDARLF